MVKPSKRDQFWLGSLHTRERTVHIAIRYLYPYAHNKLLLWTQRGKENFRVFRCCLVIPWSDDNNSDSQEAFRWVSCFRQAELRNSSVLGWVVRRSCKDSWFVVSWRVLQTIALNQNCLGWLTEQWGSCVLVGGVALCLQILTELRLEAVFCDPPSSAPCSMCSLWDRPHSYFCIIYFCIIFLHILLYKNEILVLKFPWVNSVAPFFSSDDFEKVSWNTLTGCWSLNDCWDLNQFVTWFLSMTSDKFGKSDSDFFLSLQQSGCSRFLGSELGFAYILALGKTDKSLLKV